jgi:hypothetical protein
MHTIIAALIFCNTILTCSRSSSPKLLSSYLKRGFQTLSVSKLKLQYLLLQTYWMCHRGAGRPVQSLTKSLNRAGKKPTTVASPNPTISCSLSPIMARRTLQPIRALPVLNQSVGTRLRMSEARFIVSTCGSRTRDERVSCQSRLKPDNPLQVCAMPCSERTLRPLDDELGLWLGLRKRPLRRRDYFNHLSRPVAAKAMCVAPGFHRIPHSELFLRLGPPCRRRLRALRARLVLSTSRFLALGSHGQPVRPVGQNPPAGRKKGSTVSLFEPRPVLLVPTPITQTAPARAGPSCNGFKVASTDAYQ